MKKFLSNFEQEFLDNFIKKIRINHFYKKDIVFPKEKFFYEVLIVINGSVSQSDSEDILVPGNVFGLEFNDAKLAVYPSPKTYTALEHTFIGYIHRDIIQIIRKQ
jgi:signal-transduction protein with cAMP-binding, CBS, and nucleotidyltransferase domain